MSDLGNKKIMADNILYYMNKNNKSRNDLCNDLGFKYTTLTGWITAEKYPRIDKIEKMANYFNISKSDLVEKEKNVSTDYILDKDEPSEQKKGVQIPVLGKVAAGIPIEAIENIIDYEEISVEMARRGEYFALKIQGNSMEPRIFDGDVVIVRKQPDIESGEIAIVLVNGNDATCKKVVKHEHGMSLVSNNPVYSPMFYTIDEINSLPISIIGKVVELRGKF